MIHNTDRRMLGFALVALAFWLLMFVAGTDVWHDTGRPDIFTQLSERGATRFDMRACAYAFYGLFVVLAVQVITTAAIVVRRR